MTAAAFLAEVAAAVPTLGGRRVLVAVDGVDGAGKTVFADRLAAVLSAAGRTVLRASLDDFHRPRAERHRRGRTSPEGFWLDSYDYAALDRELLAPLGPDGDGWVRTAVHDLVTDRKLTPPPVPAPPGTVLVLDGLFLHRDELAGRFDLSVWLDVPFEVTAARMSVRDGTPADPDHPALARYVDGQRLYFDACRPWERADLVVDNSDWDAPRVVRRPARER